MTGSIEYVRFPSVSNATEDGLLAMGGNLSVNTLVSAYAQGIFPWFTENQPVLWWSPDPRLVLFPNQIKISRSLRKSLKNQDFEIRCNSDFEGVIKACALRGRSPDEEDKNPEDTWITQTMHDAYCELHTRGYAHSIECWQNDKLVGGLYGVALGKLFFGESMFTRKRDASKVALVALCQALEKQNFSLIDCQVYSDHLASLGAVEIPREEFLKILEGTDIQSPMHHFADFF